MERFGREKDPFLKFSIACCEESVVLRNHILGNAAKKDYQVRILFYIRVADGEAEAKVPSPFPLRRFFRAAREEARFPFRAKPRMAASFPKPSGPFAAAIFLCKDHHVPESIFRKTPFVPP